MVRLVLTGIVFFGCYILFSGLVAMFYSMGMDMPGIEFSPTGAKVVLSLVVSFLAWRKMED